jgi:hypothetical protein
MSSIGADRRTRMPAMDEIAENLGSRPLRPVPEAHLPDVPARCCPICQGCPARRSGGHALGQLGAEQIEHWARRAFCEWAIRPRPLFTFVRSRNSWQSAKSASDAACRRWAGCAKWSSGAKTAEAKHSAGLRADRLPRHPPR